MPFLDEIITAGKMVLDIEYVQDASKVSDAYSRVRAQSYIPYASIRDLNRLVTNAGLDP